MRTYGLIGYPLGHSFSRKYFTDKFQAESKPEQYLNFEIEEIGMLPDIIASHPELAGLNVTIPYKEKVIPFLDRLDDVAAEIGAVNTIRISSVNGITLLEGFNTDVAGFSGSLKPLLKPWHKRALILGSGGASKAVKYSLERLGIEWLQVTRRPIAGESIGYDELSDFLLESYTLIINTTPLGTFPNIEEFPEIPYRALTAKHLLFDLVYNPSVTRFLSLGKAQGATIKNGYEMLEIQALESYRIWEPQAPAFGKEPAARQKSKG